MMVMLVVVLILQVQVVSQNKKLERTISILNSRVTKVVKKIDGNLNGKVVKKLTSSEVAIPIEDSPTEGALNPVLILVEFTDIECIYCAKLAPTIQKFVQDHPNRVQVVFKHFPLSFHKNAKAAHIALLAAKEQGKFFEYRYELAKYSNRLNQQLYLEIAQRLDLNLEQFQQALQNKNPKLAKINKDILLGNKLGVRGTPTLYANGVIVKNRSYAGLKALLEEASK